MPKFKVLKDKVFGEGWTAGQIVDMDENSAKVRLEKGDIERAVKEQVKEVTSTPKLKKKIVAKKKKTTKSRK